MSTGGRQYSHIEYVQEEQEKSERWQTSSEAERIVNECARSINHGSRRYIRYVAVTLRDDLIPLLFTSDGKQPEDYERDLDSHKYGYYDCLHDFVEDPDHYIDALSPENTSEVTDELTSFDVAGPDNTEAVKTVKRAYLSCAAIAEVKNFVLEELTDEGDALGFATKLGLHKQNPKHNFGDEVGAVTTRLGSLKSLYTGGTGSGKSTGASAQIWDYYLANFRDVTIDDDDEEEINFKCLDPIGMSVGENVNCYDVPQSQGDLRERREKYGLPVDITEDGVPTPKTDLYIPLTPDLESEKLPFDTENEEFVPKPFVVPASNFSSSLLTAVIDAYVSDSKERTIRDAYIAVDERMDDWALADLADEIKGRSELSEKHTKDAVRALRTLQSLGFIRTRECDHDHPDCDDECRFLLNLDDVMRDTETITRISQSKMNAEFDQLVVVAYILDRIWDLRWKNYHYEPMAMWLRELWEIAPHGMARRDHDEREEAVLENIVRRLKKMQRKPRDIQTHIIADTQEPNDIEKSVRRKFNRYVVYSSNDSTLSNIFSWVGKDGKEAFKATLSDEPGQGGIIGGCEPAIGNSRVWGMSPVRFTPPPWHHHDKDNDGNGWKKRVELMETEDFRQHGWPTAIPKRLKITIETSDGGEDEFVDAEQIDKETRIEIAQNMRDQGMTVREIADNVGRGRTWVSNNTTGPDERS